MKGLVWCLFHFHMFFFFYSHFLHSSICTHTCTNTHISKHTYVCPALHKRNHSMNASCHGIFHLHVTFCFSLFANRLPLPFLCFLFQLIPQLSLGNQCLQAGMELSTVPSMLIKLYRCLCVHMPAHTITHTGNCFDYGFANLRMHVCASLHPAFFTISTFSTLRQFT